MQSQAADMEEDDGAGGREKGKKRKKHVAEGPPLFSELDPDFVISFKEQKLARFMQLRVKLMSRDPEIIEVVEQYKPILRNNLLLLFSSQKFEDVITREGKEKLLEQALEEVNRTLDEEAGSDGVDAVYFTSFVAQ
jgi:flagellar FliL protein